MTIHPDRADDYLRHILQAIDRATAYAQKAGELRAFEQDVLLQDGIIRNIGVIGEAAVKIAQSDPGIVATYPSVPWRDMQTMRHKLVHDYFDVDLSIVWDTVRHDLPKLAVQIRQVLEEISAAGPGPTT
jgi:uncharacterized protein with HEPN domain